ncbi:MAG TPA: hypothetical protein VMH86_07125 [Rhizomicrobium sp.]|nr:hypothetical protein [Rhizomicrobium sp.]
MRTALLASAFALACTAALAGPLDSRFGNTTITRDGQGNETHIYYAADGTLTGKQNGQPFKGSWKLNGGTVCLTFDPVPQGATNPTCVPVSDHKVGDSWGTGPYTVTLVKGIQ